MKRRIVRIGDPILTSVSNEVKDFTEVKKIVKDMFDTMHANEGIGLAAPQIGIPLRICVVDVPGKDPRTLINPEVIHATQNTVYGEEGCLSIPGLKVNVARPYSIIINFVDEDNVAHQRYYSDGLECRAICHEIDHLNGILITDYVMAAI